MFMTVKACGIQDPRDDGIFGTWNHIGRADLGGARNTLLPPLKSNQLTKPILSGWVILLTPGGNL